LSLANLDDKLKACRTFSSAFLIRHEPNATASKADFYKMILLFAFLIGFIAGLRALTAPAATAWAVHRGWLRLEQPLSLIGSVPSVIILTLLAVVELVVDKLPSTAKRTAPPGLIGRIITGGLSGACVAVGGTQAALPGAALGVLGGVVGAFGGYQVRLRVVRSLGIRDIYVALVEDVVAIAGCLWIVSRS
jgi:uncharacterized membrane protein